MMQKRLMDKEVFPKCCHWNVKNVDLQVTVNNPKVLNHQSHFWRPIHGSITWNYECKSIVSLNKSIRGVKRQYITLIGERKQFKILLIAPRLTLLFLLASFRIKSEPIIPSANKASETVMCRRLKNDLWTFLGQLCLWSELFNRKWAPSLSKV